MGRSARGDFYFLEKHMYNLRDYTPYTDQSLTGESQVLVWSQKTGYFFSQYAFLSDFDCVKLIAIEEN